MITRTVKIAWVVAFAALVMLVAPGCGDNGRGIAATYVPVDTADGGIAIASGDVTRMTDKMVRSILDLSEIRARTAPPRVVVDSEYFKNESSSRINKNIITDRLRVGLMRAAGNRLVFVNRENLKMVLDEKDMAIFSGAKGDHKLIPPDYRLVGRIASIDTASAATGAQSRYHLFTFELVDVKNGVIVWTDKYEYKKAGQADVSYQ